jgi:hypothetical protein
MDSLQNSLCFGVQLFDAELALPRALSNPQALNSYGYANDNPITSKDPLGRDAYDISRPLGSPAMLSAYYAHAFVYVSSRKFAG